MIKNPRPPDPLALSLSSHKFSQAFIRNCQDHNIDCLKKMMKISLGNLLKECWFTPQFLEELIFVLRLINVKKMIPQHAA